MLKIRKAFVAVIGSAAVAAAVLVPTVARAGDGAQFSRDCQSTYVNKKVGDNEQWAITWDIVSETASGNVFKLDGSPPSFIECVGTDINDTDVTFDCFGSSACTGPPCGGDTQWTQIASGTSIPLTFFYPPGVDTSDPTSDCDTTGD